MRLFVLFAPLHDLTSRRSCVEQRLLPPIFVYWRKLLRPNRWRRSAAAVWSAAFLVLLLAPVSRAATRLGPPLVTGDSFDLIEISPDGRTALVEIGITRATFGHPNPRSDGIDDLVAISLVDGAWTQISEPVPNVRFGRPRFTPNSDRVIYERELLNGLERPLLLLESTLVSASLDGTRLTFEYPEEVDPLFFGVGFSADGEQILFPTARSLPDGQGSINEVYIGDAAGGPTQLLISDTGQTRRICFGQASSCDAQVIDTEEGAVVIYSRIGSDDIGSRLMSVPLTGGAPVPLHDRLLAAEPDQPATFDWTLSPDKTQIAVVGALSEPGINDLFLVPASGGPVTTLAGVTPAGNNPAEVQFSPNGSHLIYTAGLVRIANGGIGDDGRAELLALSIDGGEPVRLNAERPVNPNRIKVSPDGQHVVFETAQRLFTTPIDGGGPTQIQMVGEPVSFFISPDSERIVYAAARFRNSSSQQIFSIPVAGGEAVQLNSPLDPDFPNGVGKFEITPDGREVIFLAEEETEDVRELFSVPLNGGRAIKLNGPLIMGGGVFDFQLAAGGNVVVYLARQSDRNGEEVFAVPIRLHWTGAVSDDWHAAENWSAFGGEVDQFYPDTMTTVLIDQPGSEATISGRFAGANTTVAGVVIDGDADAPSMLRIDSSRDSSFYVSRDVEVGHYGIVEVFNQVEDSRTGSFIVSGDLINQGFVRVGGDASDLLAADLLMNEDMGVIVVEPGATLRAGAGLEPLGVVNNGAIVVAEGGCVQVLGLYRGNGTVGPGDVTVRGTLEPGEPIGMQTFGGDLMLQADRDGAPTMRSQIGGLLPGTEYDVVHVAGDLTLEGTLEVKVTSPDDPLYVPEIGDRFSILAADGGIQSRFEEHLLPGLFPGSQWRVEYTENELILSVTDELAESDFDASGTADAGDLAVWQKGLGLTRIAIHADGDADANRQVDGHDFLLWQRQHGQSGAAGSQLGAPVPEPSSLTLIIASCVLAARWKRQVDQRA